MGCAARKKSKNKTTSNYSLSSENGDNAKNEPPRTTRGGLRVYKIVILGDGGVGKSGRWNDIDLDARMCHHTRHMLNLCPCS